MSNELNPKPDPSQPVVYQIRLKGHLGREWTDWFGGLTITLEDNGDTLEFMHNNSARGGG